MPADRPTEQPPAGTELRRDYASGDWVIVSPRRSQRPDDFRDPQRSRPSCPFCPGQERPDEQVLAQTVDADGRWQIRVIANRYPVVVPESAPLSGASSAVFQRLPATGQHAVVIEHPDHDWDLPTGSAEQVAGVVGSYRDRYRALRAQGVENITVFRNHGPRAGTSLRHPHSQIVALPIVPPMLRTRLETARQRFEATGHCPYVELVERELAEGDRVLVVNEDIVALVPFAAATPYEVWLLPLRHESAFASVTDQGVAHLAQALQAVLTALHRTLDDPSYNLVLLSAPPSAENQGYFQWHMKITPRLSTAAGFELGSGLAVVSVPPEQAAAELRAALPAGPALGG